MAERLVGHVHVVLEWQFVGAAGVPRRLLLEYLIMPHHLARTALFALLAGPVSAQTIEVLKVEYVRTNTDADRRLTRVVEEGTYQIAPDGVYRIDRLDKATGTRTATIEDFRTSRRTTLHLDRREARIERSGALPRSTPSAWQQMDSQRVDLGTKQAGSLTLRGYRFTSVFAGPRGEIVHHNEVWSYMPDNPRIVPVILETRFDTPTGVEEQKVVAVDRVRVSRDIFSVPRTFKVQ